MDSIAEQAVCTAAAGEMPKFADGTINLRELFRELAESVINAVMDAEAEEMCSASGNSRNGYRPRMLNTCVGTLSMAQAEGVPGKAPSAWAGRGSCSHAQPRQRPHPDCCGAGRALIIVSLVRQGTVALLTVCLKRVSVLNLLSANSDS